jgi:hypothetical protein
MSGYFQKIREIDRLTYVFELIGDGAEQHPAQRGGGLRLIDVGLRDIIALGFGDHLAVGHEQRHGHIDSPLFDMNAQVFPRAERLR